MSYSGLLRAFCSQFEEIRDKLIDPDGGSGFDDGIRVEDAKALAQLLNVHAQELKCYVCSEPTIILLQWHFDGHQDRDACWHDICVISGRKVKRKNSSEITYVCHDCLAGRERLRERVVKTLDPILQRFDALSSK